MAIIPKNTNNKLTQLGGKYRHTLIKINFHRLRTTFAEHGYNSQ